MKTNGLIGITLAVLGIICFFIPQRIILNIIGAVLGIFLLSCSVRLFSDYKNESMMIGNPSVKTLILGIITAVISVMSFLSLKIQFLAGRILVSVIGLWLLMNGAVRIYDNIKYNLYYDRGIILLFNAIMMLTGIFFLLQPSFIISFAGRCIGAVIFLTGVFSIKKSLE